MSSNEYIYNSVNEDKTLHSMNGSIYPANWDGSEFEKYKKTEFTKLNEDACYVDQKNGDNDKKLKFYTTNHVDLLNAKEEKNFFGIDIKDQVFVPSDKIDMWSNLLNGKNGGELTNCNVRNGFGQLPLPTTPYKGQVSRGDVMIEDKSVRPVVEMRQRGCLPIDINFNERAYTLFNENIERPNAIKSVETAEVGFMLGRNGVASRFINKFK